MTNRPSGEERRRKTERPCARDIGITIGKLPTGKWNAITDVAGVKVGHVTLVRGDGRLHVGKGPIRTGVTAIVPVEGDVFEVKPQAAVYVINGFGKSLGLPQLMELGQIETPIILTNTLSVWTCANAVVDYITRTHEKVYSVNPVVGECNDGFLNDILGRHVKERHVVKAIESASSGPIGEGNVGAGTGMRGFGFKAGVGTASRRVNAHSMGVLVVTNTGLAGDLRIDGLPFAEGNVDVSGEGSIMIVVATDAALDSRQLLRLAKRAVFGLARTGGLAQHGSGDFVIAFSSSPPDSPRAVGMQPDENALDNYFRAVVEATEEAILNSLFKAATVIGRDGNRAEAIPINCVAARFGRRT